MQIIGPMIHTMNPTDFQTVNRSILFEVTLHRQCCFMTSVDCIFLDKKIQTPA